LSFDCLDLKHHANLEIFPKLIGSIEADRQTIIDKGAREGKTISTESVLRHLEASKAEHQGADRATYAVAADKLAQEFRDKYPDTIPLDEAYRLMKEW
jgi:hypothetical protein